MAYIDWDDVAKKLIPTHLRYEWLKDWVYAQIQGHKNIHATSEAYIETLRQKSDFNSAVALLRHRINDIFDPYHRNIYFEQQNFNAANSRGFNVEVPTYLNFGDIEDRISAVLDYYIHYGQTYTFNYYAATPSSTDASTHISALTSPGNTEIWSIINFYNRLIGQGFWSNIKHLCLISPSSKANSLIAMKGNNLVEVTAGGAIDYDRWGLASDGNAYMQTNQIPSTMFSDVKNCATMIYVSKLGATPASYSDLGAIQGTNYDIIGATYNGAGESVGFKGVVADTVNGGAGKVGSLLMRSVAGKLRMRDNTGYIGSEVTMAGAALGTNQKFACAHNNGGTPAQKSLNKLATIVEVDQALSLSQEIALINAVDEYNNLNSR